VSTGSEQGPVAGACQHDHKMRGVFGYMRKCHLSKESAP
jgi:hypothetical protein